MRGHTSGSGKVAELRDAVRSLGADTVICDGELSPGQLIALEKQLDVKVIDRTMLILDIFAQHAKSKEGKAQVSLAQMEYLYTRVRGWGDMMSRQAGAVPVLTAALASVVLVKRRLKLIADGCVKIWLVCAQNCEA